MTFFFSSAWALWALLGLALFLFWSHSFSSRKMKPEISVSSLELWLELEEVKKLHLKKFSDLSQNIILTILAYSLGILALSSPVITLPQKNARILFVLDCSLSMRTKISSQETVFEKAKKELSKSLDSFPADEKVALLSFPQGNFSEGVPAALKKNLSRFKATEVAEQTPDFFRFWAQKWPGEIYFLTDGAGESSKNIPGIKKISLGIEATNNLGIIDFSARPENNKYKVILGVKNFSEHKQRTSFIIKSTNKKLFQEELDIPGQESIFWKQELSNFEAQELFVTLEHKDNLIWDNYAYAPKKPQTQIWLDKVTRPLFIPLLNSIPGLKETLSQKEADVMVMGQEYSSNQKSSLIFFQGIYPQGKFPLVSKNLSPLVGTTHPFLKSVHPQLISLGQAYVWKKPLPKNTQVLLSSPAGAVIVKHSSYLYIGLPVGSYWENIPSFPIFWNNYFNQLAPNRGSFLGISGQTTNTTPQPWPNQWRNVLNYKESDNKGEMNLREWSYEQKKVYFQTSISLSSWLTWLFFFALLFLWWHNK